MKLNNSKLVTEQTLGLVLPTLAYLAENSQMPLFRLLCSCHVCSLPLSSSLWHVTQAS